jgi:acetyl esterase/lipase
MAADRDLIHPDLRRASKIMPHFTFNQRNFRIVRTLTNLQPVIKIPNDVQVDNIHIPGEDQKHHIRLRVYKSKKAVPPVPALVWIHGGGLIIGNPEMDDRCCVQFVQELGITIFSIDYGLAPERPFPEPLDDCHTALKWIHSHAQTMNIDPNRIAIGGESAGGGLAAALIQLVHDRDEVNPIFQMLEYPMLDDRSSIIPDLPNQELMAWSQDSNRFGWESYLQQSCGAENVPPYSVAGRREDLTGLPPAWIGVGTLDLFYQEDVAYSQKLKACGVDCDLVVIPGAFHGFDFADHQAQIVKDFRKLQIAALKKHLFPE